MSASLDLTEVEPNRRAGVALDHMQAERQRWNREHRRPRSLSARDALIALQPEASIVWIVGCDLRRGTEVTENDWARLEVALQRIDAIVTEAVG